MDQRQLVLGRAFAQGLTLPCSGWRQGPVSEMIILSCPPLYVCWDLQVTGRLLLDPADEPIGLGVGLLPAAANGGAQIPGLFCHLASLLADGLAGVLDNSA